MLYIVYCILYIVHCMLYIGIFLHVLFVIIHGTVWSICLLVNTHKKKLHRRGESDELFDKLEKIPTTSMQYSTHTSPLTCTGVC